MIVNPVEKNNFLIELQCSIPAAELKELFDAELKIVSKTANIKGFRPGKVPVSLIKNTNGARILLDVINQNMSELYSDYLKKNDINAYGQPLFKPADDNFKFDFNNFTDYNVNLTVIKELDVESTNWDFVKDIPTNTIELTKEEVQEAIESLLERNKELIDTEDPIDEDSFITFDGAELEGEDIKQDGHTMTFSYSLFGIKNEEVKAALMGKNPGDSVSVKLTDLQIDEGFVRRNILQLSQDDTRSLEDFGSMFKLTVKKVQKWVKGELNEEFFKKIDPSGKITTEEQLAAEMNKFAMQDNQYFIDLKFYLEFKLKSLENIEFDMPDDFFVEYMTQVNSYKEDTVKDYLSDLKKDFKWGWILTAISSGYGIKALKHEVEQLFRREVHNYFQGVSIPEDLFQKLFNDMLKNDEEYNNLANKIFAHKLKEFFTSQYELEKKPLTQKVLSESLEKLHREANPLAFVNHNHDHDHDHDHDHEH